MHPERTSTTQAADPDEVAFAANTDALVLQYTPRALLFLLAITLFWWPIDAISFSRAPEVESAVGRLRAVSLVVGLGAVALLKWSKAVRARPKTFVFALLMVAEGMLGQTLGSLPSLAATMLPYTAFSMLYPAPIPVPLRLRVMVTLLTFVALVGSFFLGGQVRAVTPEIALALSYIVFSGLGSLALGHLLRTLQLRNFKQARALERTAAELKAVNESLEDRVREQTHSLRDLAEHLSGVVEAERARVALDLHDNLGQHLTAVRMAARLARRRTPAEGAENTGPLSMLEGLVDQAHAALREIVWELRPAALDQLGLAAAIESLVRRVEAHGPMRLDLRVTDDGSTVAPPAALACFRIAQEALSNAIRHGGASVAELKLDIRAGAIELVVTDDGTGFSNEPSTTSGLGLTSMRVRAQALGGTVSVEPAPNVGVRVHLKLPAVGSAP